NRPKDAESAWRDALAHRERLAADFPAVPDYQNELAGTLGKLAMLANQRREFTAALSLLEKAGPHHQTALKARPQNPTYRQYYRNNLQTRAGSYLGLADRARLASTADELARFGYDPANDTYMAACMLCSCGRLASGDIQLAEARRWEQVRGYADRA